MSNLKMELGFYESAHRYYFDRLAELNSALSKGDIDSDEWMMKTRDLVSATMEKYDDILEHIKRGYYNTNLD